MAADQSEKKLRTQDDEVKGRGGEAVSPELPVDIILNILVRLPVKTLLRFKCVSKPWRSIISGPSFAGSVLARSLAGPAVTSLVSIADVLRPGPSVYQFFRLDHQTGLSTPIPLPDMLTASGVEILESINGFICANGPDLTRVCNPSTREVAALPHTGPDFPANLQGEIESFAALGYDPASKQYKVLKTWILFVNSRGGVFAAHKVLTIGSNSWRTLGDCPIEFPWDDCICAAGAIHIRTYNYLMEKDIFVSFDVASEKFRMLLPPGGAVARVNRVRLKLFREHPALLEYQSLWDDDSMTMYVLDGHGSPAWKELRMVLPHSWKEGFGHHKPLSISITRSGDILLIPRILRRRSSTYLVSYNVESRRMKKVPIHGPPFDQFKALNFSCEPFDFVENILSLNHLNS